MLNVSEIKRSSNRNWDSAYRGRIANSKKETVAKEEYPYHTIKGHIDHWTNMLFVVDENDFRHSIIKEHLVENQLTFIFRYEWEYKKSHPFKFKWIYQLYKELVSERDLQNFLLN
ncbi:MAG: hypothetical protein KDD50_07255 [Bdellovibrionales bacterium]|nr:hypothetical protein [Bdellovibrionales bacterium]